MYWEIKVVVCLKQIALDDVNVVNRENRQHAVTSSKMLQN